MTTPAEPGPAAMPSQAARGWGLPARDTAERVAVLLAAASVAMQPLLHPSGPLNSSPVDVTLLLTVLATAMWAAAGSVRLRAPYAAPMALLVLGGALAGLAGPLPGTSVTALFQDLVLFAWATAMTNLARRPGVLRLLSATWAWSAIGYAAVLVGSSLLGATAVEGLVSKDGNRALFTFGDPNYAATYWVCGIFVVYATQRPRRAWLRRVGYLLLIWSLVLTESNGGVLALLTGAALLLVLTTGRRFGPAAALAVALLIGAGAGAGLTVLPFSQLQAWARSSGQPVLVNSLGRSDNSSAQRSALVKEGLQLYGTDGPLGAGPGTTKELLGHRQYEYAKEAHDDYLAALVERGPLGLTGLLLLVASVALRAARVLRGPPHGWPQLPRPAGLVAALAAMTLAGVYYEILHFRYVWLLLAFTAAAAADWPRQSAVTARAVTGSAGEVR